MSEVGVDQISTQINHKLDGLSETSCEQFIFKIHEGLRKTNEMAYEPEILSVGPYHRGKKKLQKMEKYKLEYLKGMLRRRNDLSVETCIQALMQEQEKARSYYADHVNLSNYEFVEMMLLDGCFIIELFRKYDKEPEELKDDPSFKMSWILNVLRRDLLLFENQVPFFILEKLFNMPDISNPKQDLRSLAKSFLNFIQINTSYDIKHRRENVFHLLSLMYEISRSSFAEAIKKEGEGVCRLDSENKVGRKLEQEDDPIDIESIKTVTELKKNMGLNLWHLKKVNHGLI